MANGSIVILCKGIKMDKNYTNVLNYSEEQMLELCRSKKMYEKNDYSFIRSERNTMSVKVDYGTALQCNYLAFQNKDYSNKWFFAWINEVSFTSPGVTKISFTVDSWSTWWDKWILKPCWVNREHVNDDTIGAHTVPENLDIGEIICEKITKDTSYDLNNGYYIIIESTYNPCTKKDFKFFTMVNSIPAGSQYFAFKINPYNDITYSEYKQLIGFMAECLDKGKIDSIKNMYIVPDASIRGSWLEAENLTVTDWKTSSIIDIINEQIAVHNGDVLRINHLTHVQGIENFDTEIDKRTNFSGITIKNNKCFTYPYNYIFVTNNTGNNNIFKYENFSTTKCKFRNYVGYTQGADSKLVPLNHKGKTYDDDEAIPLGKYPNCSWSSDGFTNWLTQNAVNIPASVITTAISSAAGLAVTTATGGALAPVGAGLVTTGASTLANLIGEFHQASLLPSIQSGQNNGNVNFSANKNGFTFYEMRSKNEYIKIIDDYFTRYGYKVNRIKRPNLSGRQNWNYVEIGENSDIGYGDVPSQFMEEINGACRKGVTIWHNHDNLGDFSLSNNII